MTLKEFAEKLSDMAPQKREEFNKHINSTFSESLLNGQALRKSAARVLHIFMLIVMEDKDDDWGECVNFKDIYDCRICANAIAQVCVKGFMKPVKKNEFGAGLPLETPEACEIFKSIVEYYTY